MDDEREEVALAWRAAHGDDAAFHAIVASYQDRLLLFLIQMIGDVERARDILQDTFMAAFRALPTWRPMAAHDHPLAPWLYRIATNCAMSYFRADKQERSQIIASPIESQTHPSSVAWEDRFVARELLRQALTALDEDDAACLVLHFVAGERYGEIATRMGLTSEAVRKRVARALVALRTAYAALDVEVKP